MSDTYCEETTLQHSIAKENPYCVDFIQCIIKTDSFHKEKKNRHEERCEDYKKVFFGNRRAINFDCVTGKESSVDMVIGLNNKKFLLVELKLNVGNMGNILRTIKITQEKFKKSQEKIKNTMNARILIVCDKVLNDAKNAKKLTYYKDSLKNGKLIPMTLSEFKQEYFH